MSKNYGTRKRSVPGLRPPRPTSNLPAPEPMRLSTEKPDFAKMSVAEIKAYLSLEPEFRKKIEASRFLNFEPLVKPGLDQAEVFRALRDPTVDIVIVCGGNKAGKTHIGSIAANAAAKGYWPEAISGFIPEQGEIPTLPAHKVLIASESFQSLLPREMIPQLKHFINEKTDLQNRGIKRNQQGIDFQFRYRTGVELTAMSYEQDKKDYEGINWNFVWFDEPPPRDILIATIRGCLLFKAKILITMTPLTQAYLLDEYIMPGQTEGHGLYGKVKTFYLDAHGNCRQCHGGYVDHERFESFWAGLRPEEVAARRYGLFLQLQGLEFQELDEAIHFVPDFRLAQDWPLFEVIDPSYTRGFYVVWATCDPQDNFFVIRAQHIQEDSFSGCVREIQQTRKEIGKTPNVAIMDARGGAQVTNIETEETWFKSFKRYGMTYHPSTETPMQTLHDWLAPTWSPEKEKLIAKLRFCQGLKKMTNGPLWALQRFIWGPDSTKQAQYRQPGKDWVDCLRYLSGYKGLSFRRFREGGSPPQRQVADTYGVPRRDPTKLHYPTPAMGPRGYSRPYGRGAQLRPYGRPY